jgi:hypothetical protein
VSGVLARRLLILAIVLLLVSALAAGLTPRRVAAPVPQSPAALPAGTTVSETIPAAEGADTPVRVRRGDVLELAVEGDVIDTVLLERLDRLDGITPESRAYFSLLVEAPAGLYPIRLVEADRRIGSIQVTE